jgi:hypothetical protein
MPKYLNWVLRAEKDKVRFVTGTGARFAVLDVAGNGFLSVTKDVNFLFPKDHTQSVLKVLDSASEEKITIKKTKDSNPNSQIVFEFGSIEILFVNLDSDMKYIDENTILNNTYGYKYVTKISDWEFVGKGIEATFNEELRKERRIQNATTVVDKANSTLLVKTNDIMKSSRKVPLLDSSVADNKDIVIYCNAPYIKEIFAYGSPEDNVQIESTGEPQKPILIRHYASDTVKDGASLKKINESSGISEQFTIFFATLPQA